MKKKIIFCFSVILLFPILFLNAQKNNTIRVAGSFPQAQVIVTIAGTFNGWDIAATAMEKEENSDTWYVDLALEPGTYEYKFVIDGEWEPGNNRKMYVYKDDNGQLTWSSTPPQQETVSAPDAGLANAPAFDPKKMVKITYSENLDASKVMVAGSFNNWNTDEFKMWKNEKGEWELYLALEPGEYEFKFLPNGEWEPGDNRKMFVSRDESGNLTWSSSPKAVASPAKKITVSKKEFDPTRMVRVVYPEAANASKVTIAGSFNSWNPEELLMWKNDNGEWEIYLPLEPGEYEYKFIIDGNWIEGENLRMKVVRGADGKLKIKKPRPASNTPASPKVFISGDFYMHYDFKSMQDTNGVYSAWKIDKPRELLNINFDVRVNENVRAYSSLQFKATEQEYSSLIRKSGIDAKIGQHLQLRLFYAKPLFTYNRPLNPWQSVISSRVVYYDELNFAYQGPENPYKIGAQMSGLFVQGQYRGVRLNLLYADDLNSIEDYIYVGINKKFFGSLDWQALLMSYRGRHWERAQSSDWYHFEEEDIGSAESWYQLYEYENIYQTDFYYAIQNGRILPYLAYRFSDQNLGSIYWNQRSSTNINLYKKWDLRTENIILMGLYAQPVSFLKADFNLKLTSTNLQDVYKKEYNTDKMGYLSLKFKMLFQKKPYMAEFGYWQAAFDNFDEYRHYYFDEGDRSLALDPYNYNGITLLNTIGISKIYFNLKYTFRNFDFKLNNKYYMYKLSSGSNSTTLESVFNIYARGFVYDLFGNLRLKRLNLANYFNYSFLTPFVGMKLRPTKSFEMLVGYGYSPYIFTDYTAYFYDGLPYEIMDEYENGTSINNMINLYNAEQAMESNHIFTIIGKIKF